MELFKHKFSGVFYRLTKKRKSNVNTYLEVDELNTPIVKKRKHSFHPQEQSCIIIGFDKLIKI